MLLFQINFVRLFERGVGLKSLVDYFVRAACGFGFDVSDDYFAVFFAFHKGVDVASGLFFGGRFAFITSAVKEAV
jgi:hypothetical protein